MTLQPVQPDGGAPGDPLPAKRLTIAVPLVLAGLGLGIGLSHLYVRKRTIGLTLVCVWVASLLALFAGQYWGLYTMIAVWVVDLVGGLLGVRSYNRLLEQAEAPLRRFFDEDEPRPRYLN